MFRTSFKHNRAGLGVKENLFSKRENGFGGVFYIENPQTDVLIQNCTFYLNHADKRGPDMYLKKVSKLRMTNCILASKVKSHSIWTHSYFSLDTWNTSFVAGNSTVLQNHNFKNHLDEPVAAKLRRFWKITETPFASGKCHRWNYYATKSLIWTVIFGANLKHLCVL